MRSGAHYLTKGFWKSRVVGGAAVFTVVGFSVEDGGVDDLSTLIRRPYFTSYEGFRVKPEVWYRSYRPLHT